MFQAGLRTLVAAVERRSAAPSAPRPAHQCYVHEENAVSAAQQSKQQQQRRMPVVPTPQVGFVDVTTGHRQQGWPVLMQKQHQKDVENASQSNSKHSFPPDIVQTWLDQVNK